MITSRSEAIKHFLDQHGHPDLAKLYTREMEVQVNVRKTDSGERIGEFKGKDNQSYRCNGTFWYPFRIPKKANKDPIDNDKPLNYSLEKYADAIGMTGWNWVRRVSCWVGYDFDSICNHSQGLSDADIDQIRYKLEDIEWVTIRRSTSGKGLHIYVPLPDVPTGNHDEHAALARSLLDYLSIQVGFNLKTKVDCYGQVLWVWRYNWRPPGFDLIKPGRPMELSQIPENWQAHCSVISGNAQKAFPTPVADEDRDYLITLNKKTPVVPFDKEHNRLISWLREHGHYCEFNQDFHLIITHTAALKTAFTALSYKGIFTTVSEGSENKDYNCYLFPLSKEGQWRVVRYSKGIKESSTWTQDGESWTHCFFNAPPQFPVAAKHLGGVRHIKGGFVLPSVRVAQELLRIYGIKPFEFPETMMGAETRATLIDGEIVLEIENYLGIFLDHWEEKGQYLVRPFPLSEEDEIQDDPEEPDFFVRHVVTAGRIDLGWMIRSGQNWIKEPLTHVRAALQAKSFKSSETGKIIGNQVMRFWTIVNQPFQPEYPGGRMWNREAAQLRYQPDFTKEELHYPTWLRMLSHVGLGLDNAIKREKKFADNDILTGIDYLKCWIAYLFQYPERHLPYLFLYGPENCGKSSFHESIRRLLTSGVRRVDHALTSYGGFNNEIEHTLLCIIEETDLGSNKNALLRIKDWVTSPVVTIHPKGLNPYEVKNLCHFVQTSNSYSHCPVFPGDSRITVINVDELDDPMGDVEFFHNIEREAPDFLTEIMRLKLPNFKERLALPVVETLEKRKIQSTNLSDLEDFLESRAYYVPGEYIKVTDFIQDFLESLPPKRANMWSRNRIMKEFPDQYPIGRITDRNCRGEWYVGNLSWSPHPTANNVDGKRWVATTKDRLELVEDTT